MRVHIIRHAEKEVGGYYNPELRHQDEPITLKGRESAGRLIPYYANKKIGAIYVSGYRRTGETIAPLALRLGLKPIIDQRLNEIDNGVIEGLDDATIQVRYPEVWDAFQRRSADFRFPGGETGEEVRLRIASFLEEKRRQHQLEEIILVAHDGLIRLLVCHVLGLPVYARWKFHVDFCGMTEIATVTGSEEWKLIRFNQCCN
jgi:broad specificity phosphatase PhoE